MSSLNNSIIYEIYPTSFYDSNGDGIGDINGITEKLDYVKELGADVIWINPIYKSPFKDGGYDIIDHCAVDKRFGTLEDVDKLINKAHKLGIKVLFDLVIGHTSDKHPWFLQSKKAKRNKYSDYFIWTDNIFIGGSNTVKGMAKRDGNYMVNYYSFQPALNYGFVKVDNSTNDVWSSGNYKMHYTDQRLTPLREEVLKIIDFWMQKGIDGFRVDLSGNMIKGGRDLTALKWFYDRVIGKTKEKYPNAIFLAEWGSPEFSTECGFDIDYLNHESKGYNELLRGDKNTNIMPNFENGNSYFSANGQGTKKPLVDYLEQLKHVLKADKYYSIPSGYHDMVRLAEKRDNDSLKCVFAFLLTYKNVPLIYYGDEIGMAHNYKLNKDGGYIRTGARTPMHWDNTINRGFSTAKRTYLPVGKQKDICVKSQQEDESSLLNTIKRLIEIRKSEPALWFDSSITVERETEYPFIYTRGNKDCEIFVAINPTRKNIKLNKRIEEVLFSLNCNTEDGLITLKGKSFIIAKVKGEN